MMRHNIKSFPQRQKGTVLVVSLVFLTIMTLLAISGMNMSNLQFLMAGNSQHQALALAKAETTLLTAADFAAKNISSAVSISPTSAGSGYYIADSSTGVTGAEDIINNPSSFWGSSANYKTGSDSSEKYVIEFIDNRKPVGYVGMDPNIPRRNIYRITARGTSVRGAARTLQSIVVTEQKPGS